MSLVTLERLTNSYSCDQQHADTTSTACHVIIKMSQTNKCPEIHCKANIVIIVNRAEKLHAVRCRIVII